MFKHLFGSSSTEGRDDSADRQTYAIGDVHGCAHELEHLLKKLSIDRETKVVFLGDYVDRGAYSRRVIDLILDLSARCEVIPLMGDHESGY